MTAIPLLRRPAARITAAAGWLVLVDLNCLLWTINGINQIDFDPPPPPPSAMLGLRYLTGLITVALGFHLGRERRWRTVTRAAIACGFVILCTAIVTELVLDPAPADGILPNLLMIVPITAVIAAVLWTGAALSRLRRSR